MTTWYQRLLPYPLLAPWTGDYEACEFGVDEPKAVLNNGSQISIRLSFTLSSESIQELIENGKAEYVVEVSCPRTFVRGTHVTDVNDEIVLDADEYAEEILLTPYVVAVEPLQAFTSPEHAREWVSYRPNGFDIPIAGIVAVGNSIRITLDNASVNSIIDLIANPNVSEGTFEVDLDDERIKIHVPLEEKEKIEAVRKRRGGSAEFAALFPGLYLHAVAEAVRNLSEFEHTRWAFTVRTSLEQMGRDITDFDLLQNEALKYAQELMERPVGMFLSAAIHADDEE